MIRKFLVALSMSTALCMPVYAQAETISDSVGQSLLTHPQIKAGAASLAAATKNVEEQKSGFFPVLGIDGQAGRVFTNNDTSRGLTADGGGAASWMGQGAVRLTQPIFTGYGTTNRFKGAKYRAAAATHDLEGAAEDISLRAARAHLNLMRTRELLDIATDFLNNIESRRKNIALMVKEGAADAAELLQADEIHVAAQNTRLGYEESYRQAEADYIEAVGAAPLEKLELGEEKWNELIPKTMDEAIAYAVEKNAHVLAASNIVSAMDREVRAERATLIPRVDAEMSYSKLDQSDLIGGESANAQALLKMGWNFATGGGQYARIGKIQQQREEANARRQGVLRTVEHDVRQKYTSMQIVDQQHVLLVDKAEASKKILDNFLAQFEGGKQSNLQLISAHSRVFDANAARIDAHYRQLLSRFELLNATGRLREAFGNPLASAKKG